MRSLLAVARIHVECTFELIHIAVLLLAFYPSLSYWFSISHFFTCYFSYSPTPVLCCFLLSVFRWRSQPLNRNRHNVWAELNVVLTPLQTKHNVFEMSLKRRIVSGNLSHSVHCIPFCWYHQVCAILCSSANLTQVCSINTRKHFSFFMFFYFSLRTLFADVVFFIFCTLIVC